MSATGLGEAVAVGLLAGPEEFKRIRETRHSGVMARLWRQFEAGLEEARSAHDSLMPLADLAFGAAILQRHDLAVSAVEGALAIAHQRNWMHPEAGCTPLSGMHNVHNLSLVIDWTWPMLNRDQREALLGALIAKGIENLSRAPEGVRDEDGKGQLLIARRQDRNDPYCLHPRDPQVNNWDVWFSSGMYMAACLAERAWVKPQPGDPALEWGHYYQTGFEMDAARIARWKGLATERITTALATQLGPDGDYAEGISYADYGGRALILALSVLQRHGGLDLFNESAFSLPRWARNQYAGDVAFGVANYNDALMKASPSLPVLANLAGRSQNPEMQGYLMEAIELTSANPGHLALIGFDPTLAATPVSLPEEMHFRHNGTVIWRTAQDRSGIFFTIKSGAYGGAHQHRDRNSIFLSAYGEHLIVDTGDCRYINPPYPEFANTIAHNCLLIDGKGQVGTNDDPTVGKILENATTDGISTALADASACYEGITSCTRRVVFLRPDLLVMTDRVVGDCAELTWLLQGYNPDGQAGWACGDRQAVFTRPGARLHVFLAEPIDRFAVTTAPLDGQAKGILRLESVVPGKAVTAVLVPSRADEPAPTCAWAADGTLTIAFRGKTHTVVPGTDVVTVNGQGYTC
ncbi:MAG: heparinase II/III domain-containing protein [Armatimonadota bacterium]